METWAATLADRLWPHAAIVRGAIPRQRVTGDALNTAPRYTGTIRHPVTAKELTMAARLIESGLFSLLVATSAEAAATSPVQSLGIKLQDPSSDPSIAHMRIVLDHDTLRPGRVTLTAQNQSKTTVHEVLVVRARDERNLPFDAKADRVIEKHAHPLGEISDLAPGKTGQLTLNLKAGIYVLFCNQPGHYKDGMFGRLTVAP